MNYNGRNIETEAPSVDDMWKGSEGENRELRVLLNSYCNKLSTLLLFWLACASMLCAVCSRTFALV